MKNYDYKFSLKGIKKSFKHSVRGFEVLLRYEYNLYIQLVCAFLITVAGFMFSISYIEWALQAAVIGLVIFSELINTAIEKIMDMINPEYDERVRDIKDLASGTVLFTVAISVFVAGFIYIPKIIELL